MLILPMAFPGDVWRDVFHATRIKWDEARIPFHSKCIALDGYHDFPDSKAHGANMGPIWGRQDPGGPHIGPMNFAIWVMLNK